MRNWGFPDLIEIANLFFLNYILDYFLKLFFYFNFFLLFWLPLSATLVFMNNIILPLLKECLHNELWIIIFWFHIQIRLKPHKMYSKSIQWVNAISFMISWTFKSSFHVLRTFRSTIFLNISYGNLNNTTDFIKSPPFILN